VKWALYEEKHFGRLIEDIIELVNGLVDLHPPLQTVQRELCKREVSEFVDDGSLPLLKDIAKNQDKDLTGAISKALERTVNRFFCGFFIILIPFDSHLDRALGASQNTWKTYNSKVGEQEGGGGNEACSRKPKLQTYSTYGYHSRQSDHGINSLRV
jgi:hypothetical protein